MRAPTARIPTKMKRRSGSAKKLASPQTPPASLTRRKFGPPTSPQGQSGPTDRPPARFGSPA